jgi:hypothetical protein
MHREPHFMHYGAFTHFNLVVQSYMKRKFPGQWTGRGGPIARPPRSRDLNPLDFYLWDHLKSLIYSSTFNDVMKSNCGRLSDNTHIARNLELFLGAMRRQTEPLFRQEMGITNSVALVRE